METAAVGTQGPDGCGNVPDSVAPATCACAGVEKIIENRISVTTAVTAALNFPSPIPLITPSPYFLTQSPVNFSDVGCTDGSSIQTTSCMVSVFTLNFPIVKTYFYDADSHCKRFPCELLIILVGAGPAQD